MADSPASPATIDPNFKQPESDNPNRKPDTPATSTSQPEQQQQQQPSIINPNPSPNPNQTPAPASLPPAPVQSFAPPTPVQSFAPPTQPISYRPVPMSTASQFSPVQNYQSPVVQPPGVGGVAVTMAPPMMQYPGVPGQPPNPALRPYAPIPNGYGAVPAPASGLPRYPAPYPSMVRPAFPPRPPGPVGVLPSVARPPVPGIPGVRPMMPPVVRPVPLPSVTPAEKPQTKVYVGKIAPTADSDFVLSVLKVCGTVKSWKRAQDPSNGTPKGFGFCEFESAEGVLRALRLLNKFNIDGQELMLNVDQATREYLERYVDKKTENTKTLKETQDAGAGKEDESVQSVEKNEPSKAPENLKDNETGNKESHDPTNFGIVTEEDRKADQEALEKLACMVEERLKTNPLPPPPPQTTADGSGISNSELPAKARDGDSDVDMIRNDIAEDKLDDETTSDTKASDHDRPETSSPDRSRVHDRRGRDKERDLKREKEREIDRYEREAERERVRKEREQRRKIEEAEREYERCLKDWEYREREREKERQYEKEKEKERERKRKKEIVYDEEEDEDDSRKRWRRSVLEEKRRKRIREKEEDLADKVREEEEIAVAKRRAEEERLQQQQRDALKLLSDNAVNGSLAEESAVESKGMDVEHDYHDDSIRENHMAGDPSLQNGNGDESTNVPIAASDMRQSGNVPARKLGFGLVGSGKRTAVPSVFHVEDDDDADKDKKMRPLVPIDYSTEELQAAQPHVSGANPLNLAAAAEFAKRISNVNSKEEKSDAERERSRRSHDRSSQREKDRSDEDNNRTRDEHKEKILDRDRDREHGLDKVKTPDNKKLLDAKQLIDMIPKTKEELFSYEINWAVYDKHELHERMRPWISKKITEFLGEEETTLVDYIVSSTQDHVKASQMLELLQTILDDEAEMFVLKMWRMLIFEIKKVETGLALRSKS